MVYPNLFPSTGRPCKGSPVRILSPFTHPRDKPRAAAELPDRDSLKLKTLPSERFV
jgi:hypothetical protein